MRKSAAARRNGRFSSSGRCLPEKAQDCCGIATWAPAADRGVAARARLKFSRVRCAHRNWRWMKGPVVLSGLALASILSQPSLASDAAGWAGRRDGVWSWRLPDTPDGLRPTQSWHAIGSSPSGDIYVAGMDHATNSALYRIAAATNRLRYLGDARAASEAAGNWRPGETAEKFHTRPLWLDGKVYVASLDRSTLDGAYLSRRGFHWYAYDAADGRFRDLSAVEPGGVGAPHLGLVTLAGDPARRLIYGAAVPTGE